MSFLTHGDWSSSCPNFAAEQTTGVRLRISIDESGGLLGSRHVRLHRQPSQPVVGSMTSKAFEALPAAICYVPSPADTLPHLHLPGHHCHQLTSIPEIAASSPSIRWTTSSSLLQFLQRGHANKSFIDTAEELPRKKNTVLVT
ncbi:hypothetical protein KSP40_PGU009124 [Platanthera guangdongensis]|uniref:Uncharacterized protein n=1 Tax=Platanthera guangdongensis TaxID=2320717 RepID=A0ABR2MS74_9ASPA